MKKIALFSSANGRAVAEIIQHYKNGKIKPEIALLLSTNSTAMANEVAIKNSIPLEIINRNSFTTKTDYELEILRILDYYQIDIVYLCGYTPIVGKTMINKYLQKIINIHPALLPSFKGLNAIDQALTYGVKYTGITIHYVIEEIDSGEIIDQRVIRINKRDKFSDVDKKIFQAGIKLSISVLNKHFS